MRYLRLGIAGMRGEVGSGLTPALAIDFASALGTYLEGGRIIVASDTRTSSPMLHHAVLAALTACGCSVIDAGIAPAPEIHFFTPYMEADGALLLGAGHHPAGWNAIVPIWKNGAYFNSVQLQELLDIYHGHRYASRSWDKVGTEEFITPDAHDAYLDALFATIDTDLIKKHKYRVIADFCNGAGSALAGKFAERLGIEMISINDSVSGVLPHDPEPRPRSSMQVRSVIKPLKADVGFVFNSDMSRVAVVTDNAEPLSEEYSFPLLADHVLASAKKDSIVVTNCCTTRTLDDIVRKHKCKLIKTKVGQAHLIDRMIETSAVLAGDGSGGAAAANGVNGFDSYMIMAKILEAMAQHDLTSSQLAGELPRYHIVKRKINCLSSHAYTILRNFKNVFNDAKISEEDGLRFDWPSGWLHLRASATEPVIRMIVEWKTKEDAEEKAFQAQGILERLAAI